MQDLISRIIKNNEFFTQINALCVTLTLSKFLGSCSSQNKLDAH